MELIWREYNYLGSKYKFLFYCDWMYFIRISYVIYFCSKFKSVLSFNAWITYLSFCAFYYFLFQNVNIESAFATFYVYFSYNILHRPISNPVYYIFILMIGFFFGNYLSTWSIIVDS